MKCMRLKISTVMYQYCSVQIHKLVTNVYISEIVRIWCQNHWWIFISWLRFIYKKKFFNIPYIWSQYSTTVLSVSFWNSWNTWQLTEPILWNALQRVICHIILKLLLPYLLKLGALFVIMLSERTSDLTAYCDTRTIL